VTKPLDELYLEWLYSNVVDPRGNNTYWNLLRALFVKEFFWFVPNDDNRIEDGRALRYEFIEDLDLDVSDPEWMRLGCSMLEMLVGLSRRLSLLGEGGAPDCFWQLMANLGLRIPDRKKFPAAYVDETLDRVISRTYEPNGRGGLFPLCFPKSDQRDVEIWGQLNAYLLERE
jgi:hypothetical protein